MKKLLLFLVAVFLFPQEIFASDYTHLVISQIQVSGDGGSNDEFIEIYNPTASDVSLAGWSLQYKSSSGEFPLTSGKKNLPSDAVVSSGKYYLIAHSSYNGSVIADHTHSSFTLSGTSSGATVFLVNSTTFLATGTDNAIIDKIAYGSSESNSPEGIAAAVPGSEQSLIRSQDTDNNSSDFSVSSSNPRNSSTNLNGPNENSEPVAGTEEQPEEDQNQTEMPQSQGHSIIISEIFANPSGSDSGGEWVELYNNSSEPIDISGWVLDDEAPASGGVGSSAYTIVENTIVSASGYLQIILPAGVFALDNTGGDTVRLFGLDGLLVSSLVYTATAPENHSYARNTSGDYTWTTLLTPNAPNQFEQAAGSSGEQTTGPLKPAFDRNFMDIRIVEVYPNPPGADSGKEWIEVMNTGEAPVSLHEWTVADGAIGSKISSSAWKIQSPTVWPGGVALLSIPSGQFALNNTGAETVRLFAPDLTLIDSVSYEGASEGRSYSLIDGQWTWTVPTPDEVNMIVAGELETNEDPDLEIIINEVYPEPGKNQEEFIELHNPNGISIDVSDWVLADASTKHKIKNLIIEPLAYAVVYKSESKLALNNFGVETITLSDPSGFVVWRIEYEDAPKGQSYNYIEGAYVWSQIITPRKKNQINPAAHTPIKEEPVEIDLVEEEVMGLEEVAGLVEGEFTGPSVQNLQNESVSVPAAPIMTPPLWLAIGFVSGVILCYIYSVIYRKKGSL